VTKKHNREAGSPVISSRVVREAAAKCLLTPSETAANAIKCLTQDIALDADGTTGVDCKTLFDELQKQNMAVSNGDLQRVEAMLLDQSHVLQSLFMTYIQKMSCAEYTEQVDVFSRIALRAQNQCRQTLTSLVELKNPKRATFVKQQNNAVNQQINQLPENQKTSCDPTNELLGEVIHEQLDTKTPQASCGVDQAMETVGEIDGAENI
jgi:hypothetical protein